jgi:aminoglycoside phosphotransferase (APT) family kinase protein
MPAVTASEPGAPVDRESLTQWLAGRLHALGCSDLVVRDLVTPSAGFSGQTVMFGATWRTLEGEQVELDLVLRLQSRDRQVYLDNDAIRQARTMQALASAPGVPVPTVVLVEEDASVFGVPFYLMERVHGQIPVDVPSWHSRGWTVDLSPQQRHKLYDNGLSALVALHRVDPSPDLTFLAEVGDGTALERYLAMVQRWYDWCRPARQYGGPLLEEAIGRLLETAPHEESEGVVWGDARMGNIVFADDLSVAAMLDWEAASTGPPGIDLGWWLMFEDLLCEAQGRQRLEGVADRDGTIARYIELGGAPIPAIDYYQLMADIGISLITSVLADNAVRTGAATPEVAAGYPNRVLSMMRVSLDRLR